MYKTCCICGRTIDEADDYDRVDTDFYCSRCSNNNLVPCPICGTYIDPDVDTEFQAPDGTLFCSVECMNVIMTVCVDCGNMFYSTDSEHICPVCIMRYNGENL